MSRKPMTVKAAPDLSTASASDLLAQVSQLATTKAPKKPTKSGAPIVFIDEKQVKLRKKVRDMICLLVLDKEVGDMLAQHKKEACDLLFVEWVRQVWRERSIPKNPRITIAKDGGSIPDLSVTFQVKFRSNGIKVPDELPPGKTVQDHILYELTSPVVGLSIKNATALLSPDGDIVVQRQFFMADFNSMCVSEDADIQSGSKKILALMLGQKSDPLTPVEREKILIDKEVIQLREGFVERSLQYCDTEQQLYNLLKYVGITTATSDAKFAEGEKRSERTERMQGVFLEFLGSSD